MISALAVTYSMCAVERSTVRFTTCLKAKNSAEPVKNHVWWRYTGSEQECACGAAVLAGAHQQAAGFGSRGSLACICIMYHPAVGLSQQVSAQGYFPAFQVWCQYCQALLAPTCVGGDYQARIQGRGCRGDDPPPPVALH